MAETPKIPTKLHLSIVTRDRKVVETEVEEVVLPGSAGALGILPGHTPLLAVLRVGELSYRAEGRTHHLAISWGFAEVLADRVIVLAEGAFLASEIDRAAAERQKQEAEKSLVSLASHDEGFALAQSQLDESIAKINISSRVE